MPPMDGFSARKNLSVRSKAVSLSMPQSAGTELKLTAVKPSVNGAVSWSVSAGMKIPSCSQCANPCRWLSCVSAQLCLCGVIAWNDTMANTAVHSNDIIFF